MEILALLPLVWLLVWLVQRPKDNTDCSYKEESEYPYRMVKISNDEDYSGRFCARARLCKETGEFEATVEAKKEDKPLITFVKAKSKEELEQKVDEAYKKLSKRWVIDKKVQKIIRGEL